MKICYLAPANSIHTIRWLNYFAERNNEIHLIAHEKPSNELNPNVIFHLIQPYGSSKNPEMQKKSPLHGNKKTIRQKLNRIVGKIAIIKRLMVVKDFIPVYKLIRKIKPDLIHAHYLSSYGLLGVLVNFHPLYISIWGSDLWVESHGDLVKYISRYTMQKADGIHCDGENMFFELTKFEKNMEKINIIHYGTDIEKFKPNNQNKINKPLLGCSDCIAVISIRALKPIYDIATLLQAIPHVLNKNPSVHFFIAGEGSEETNLKNLSKSLKIEKNVHFIGNIPNDKLPDYFLESDIYVSTSLSDGGLAASTAEAMACELPVIITDFGDNSKWISNGINGYIIPLKSPDALAKTINYLIENEEIRKTIGKKAREIIVEKNNYFKEMDKINTIYTNLTKGAMK